MQILADHVTIEGLRQLVRSLNENQGPSQLHVYVNEVFMNERST